MTEPLAHILTTAAVFSVVIVIFLPIRPLLRRGCGAQFTYALWLLLPVSLITWLVTDIAMTPEPMLSAPLDIDSAKTSITDLLVHATNAQASALPTALAALSPTLVHICVWCWFIGFIASVVRLWQRDRQLRRRCGELTPTSDPRVFAMSHSTLGPMLLGVIKSKIIIPQNFHDAYSQEQQRIILDHEHAHRQARDPLVNALSALLVCLFWFNPLSYVAARMLRTDQELACDESVLRHHGHGALRYAETLLHAQSLHQSTRTLACQWTSQHPLVTRVRALTRPPLATLRGRVGFVVNATVTLAAVAIVQTTHAHIIAPDRNDSAALLPASSAQVQLEHYNARALTITSGLRVNIVPEARSNIAIERYGHDSFQAAIVDDRLTISTASSVIDCRGWVTQAAPMAAATIRVPETFDLEFLGSVMARVAPSRGGSLRADGCGHIALSSVSGDIDIDAVEKMAVTTGSIAGNAHVNAMGASVVRVGNVVGALDAHTRGAARLSAASLLGPSSITAMGASHSAIRTVNADFSVRLFGVSALVIDAMHADNLDVEIVGEGTLEVKAGALDVVTTQLLDGGRALLNIDGANQGSESLSPASYSGEASDQQYQRLAKDIPKWLARYQVPAASVTYISGGRIAWTQVHGQHAETKSADADTLFGLASLTKPVVAEVVLRLVSQGKMTLDEPIHKYWSDPNVRNDERRKQLTPRILLQHQGGFPNWRSADDGILRFGFEPGDDTRYSGEGFDYLVRFLERKFRKPFEVLARDVLFDELQMHDTFLVHDDVLLARAADRTKSNGDWFQAWTPIRASGANGLRTTTQDYARFMLAVMSDAGISEAVAAERVNIREDGVSTNCGPDKTPLAICPPRMGFGLSWYIYHYEDHTVFAHTGSNWGEKSIALFSPERDMGIVVATNGNAGFDVVFEIVRALYGNERFIELERG
ncbi:MAG: M56 family metallopeptidase [Pseudomonadota bacterium]